ncbi:MAG: hypothetical protein U0263_18530 [Polyangiaceae bacterium]
MQPQTQKPKPEAELADPWFAEPAPASENAPVMEDPELDAEWFLRGRPLSSRPPPPRDEN